MRLRWIAEDRFEFEPPWMVILWDLTVFGLVLSILAFVMSVVL